MSNCEECVKHTIRESHHVDAHVGVAANVCGGVSVDRGVRCGGVAVKVQPHDGLIDGAIVDAAVGARRCGGRCAVRDCGHGPCSACTIVAEAPLDAVEVLLDVALVGEEVVVRDEVQVVCILRQQCSQRAVCVIEKQLASSGSTEHGARMAL